MSTYKSHTAFTLIELLLVLSILSMVTIIVIANASQARKQGRDAKRKGDLQALRVALEVYNESHNGYPVVSGWASSERTDLSGSTPRTTDFIPGLTPAYIPAMPRDPKGGPSSTCGSTWYHEYLYTSDGPSYKLLSHCAPEGAFSTTDNYYDPLRPTWAWMVCGGSATACNG